MFKELKKSYNNMPVQVKASFWFLICSFMQKGISTIATPIFTRLLTTAEYGQYNVFNSWLGIVTIFVSLNLSAGVYSQGLIKYENDRNIFSSSLQGLSTVLTIIWTVIYLLFPCFWNNLLSLTTVQMFSMLVMIWATSAFCFWASEQRVLYKYKALVTITIVVSLAKPILGIVFVIHAKDKVTAQILGLVLVELIAYTILFIKQMRRGKKFFSEKYWRYALMFNLPLVPHYLSQTILSSADRIMIKSMTGDAAAGIYSLAYSIALIMTLFNTALMQTISPWIYQKIKAKKIEDISTVAYITLFVVAGVNLLLIAFAPEAVAIFAPKSYFSAIYVIPPVAMSVFFMYTYDLFAKFAFYYEKTAFIMIASVIGALLNIILNYIFIGIYGYQAAGYTTLICYIIYSICHYIFMNSVCDQCCCGIRPYDIKIILVIAVPFVFSGLLLLFTYHYAVIRYGIMIIALITALIKRENLINLAKKILALKGV